MAYTYSVIVNGTLFNLEEIVDSRTLKIVKPFCSTKKTSGKGTMSVVIRGAADKVAYQNFMQAFLASQYAKTVNDCSITVSKDGTPVFIGYLDKSTIDIVSKKIPQDLTLSANDKSSLLDEKIRYNHIYELNGAGQSRNAIVRDLFSKLSTDSGITVSLVSTDLSDADICAPFSITEDKGETYRDVIDRILLEAIGYVLVFDPSVDGFRIKRIPTDIVGVTPREVSYLVNDSLRTKSAIYEKDGILLSFPNIVRRENTNLYSENISLKIDDNGYIEGTKVQPGEYYPPTADVAKVYQEFRMADRPYISGESRLQNKDLELLFARSVSVGLASNPNLTLAPALPSVEWTGTVEYLPTKARAIYLNNSGKESNITDFTYTGTATYIDSYNKVTYPKACVKPEEYTAKTIIDADKAKRFACWLYNSKNYGETTSQWAEYDSSAYLGEIVNVIHKGTGVQMPHVIVQITDESVSGTRVRKSSIVAISIYSWSAYDEEDASLIETLSPSNPSGEAKLIKTLAQYYHSYSLETLIPNVFVVTSDTERQNGKTYYEENLGLSDRYVVSMDNPLVEGKTYYEDASWLDHIVERTGGIYYVNGHLVPTQDSTPQIGVTYYYYDSVSGEYVVFSGSTFDPDVAYFEYEEYPSYVWHRQKFIYSNGDVAYSSYAYYLTTADVANPFTITTLFGTSTSANWAVTTDVTPVPGKEYYIYENGKYRRINNDTFPTGATIYEIPNFVGWNDAIPSTWKKGLYIWYKENTVYENQPEKTIEDSPKFSQRFTQEMEATCVFEGRLGEYTWNKNMRSVATDDVIVNVFLNIVGYGSTITPVVTGLPSSVSVSSSGNSVSLIFNSNINESSLSFQIGMAEYPSETPLSFTINSVDITEKPMYLGLLSSLPSDPNMNYLDGDHFVPNQNITVGADTYLKLMPYVYSNGSWVAVQEGTVYGGVPDVQIMYDCAKDIYANADYTYENCETGERAVAGVSYYQQTEPHSPVVVEVGELVENYATRHIDVPQAVVEYYNYQQKLMAEHIVAEDIELARGGKIRSAGYQKGTAQKIIDEMQAGHSVSGYNPGFYGDNEGNFEAYSATLVDAQIYFANITGELRNELFETQLESEDGARYIQNTPSDTSWDANEAIDAIKDAGLTEDVITPVDTHYKGTLYGLAMLVPNNQKRVTPSTIVPDGTDTMPIQAKLENVVGRLFIGNTEVFSGTTVARNSVLTNIKRWNISKLRAYATKNSLKTTGVTWNGNNYAYANVDNPQAVAVNAVPYSWSAQSVYTANEWVDYTVPDWFPDTTITIYWTRKESYWNVLFSGTYYDKGYVRFKKNGDAFFYLGGGTNGEAQGAVSGTATVTVKAGDRLSLEFGYAYQPGSAFGSGQSQNASLSFTIPARTFADLGFSTVGFRTFTVAYNNGKAYIANAVNRGANNFYAQTNSVAGEVAAVTYSEGSLSWNSNNNCEDASFEYTYGLYDNGFNVLNASGEKQECVPYDMRPISEAFDWAYNGHSWDSSNASNHYFHLNSKPLKAFIGGAYVEVESGKVFAIDQDPGDPPTISYQKKNGTLISGTDVQSVIWSSTTLSVERSSRVELIRRDDWLKSFSIEFLSLARVRGNYADSISPIMSEADRQTSGHKIYLGRPENRFDEVNTIDLGERNQPIESAFAKNLNLIPQTGISSFITGVTYYYFDNGILVPESSSTPVSGRQYFILGSAANYAYFDTLAMLDSMDNQKKRIDNLFVKLAQVEQSLSSSTTMIPSSKAVNDAIMNISNIFSNRWDNIKIGFYYCQTIDFQADTQGLVNFIDTLPSPSFSVLYSYPSYEYTAIVHKRVNIRYQAIVFGHNCKYILVNYSSSLSGWEKTNL